MRRQIINLIIHHITSHQSSHQHRNSFEYFKIDRNKKEKKLKTKPPVNYDFDHREEKKNTPRFFSILSCFLSSRFIFLFSFKLVLLLWSRCCGLFILFLNPKTSREIEPDLNALTLAT